MLQRRADPQHLVGGERVDQPHGLRVAHPERDQRQHLGAERHVLSREPFGLSHRGPEHWPRLLVVRHQFQPLDARVGVDDERGAHRRGALQREERRESSHAVARDLRDRAVGVVQPHARALVVGFEEHQAVGADAGRAGAHVAGQCRQVAASHVGKRRVEEVVAVGVGFPEVHIEGTASQNCLRLSSNNVTGPSLTSATCMSARKTPERTCRPRARQAAIARSYQASPPRAALRRPMTAADPCGSRPRA